MKRNKLYLIAGVGLITTALFLASCNDEVLNLMPKDTVGYEDAFSTPAMCELSMVGCYDAAQSGYYPGNNQRRGYPFGAASVEQGDMRGEDMLNVQAFFAITYGSTYGTSSPNGQAHWECTYQMINKINICIEGFQLAATRNIITAEQAKAYEAEAKFLRALGYHELLIHFARPYKETADGSHPGVPLNLVPINSIEKVEAAKSAGRATVKQVYDQILLDLEYAETNLPATRASKALSISRATKGAAIGLKTRIYQHMGDQAKVITEAAKIVNASQESPIGGYKLTAEPNGPFMANSNNTESMFSIENTELDNATVNGSLSQFYSSVRSLVCISPIIYNEKQWLANDKRRTQLVLYSNAYSARHLYWVDKYKAREKMSDWTPILRYAEVLLNYAEAEARQNGKTQLALDLLNKVRNRAVDAADQFTLASFATADDLIKAILMERRIELVGEGRRWADIHRLAKDPKFFVAGNAGVSGVPAKVATGNVAADSWKPATGTVDAAILKVAPYDYSDKRYVFPIPDSETATNPKLKEQQNPGW
ncbi:MAG: RagB/SusD family nutrient uptake outer membrane protein [Paludibacter sp.]|jgi:hypothetical protein|nr:RagB/SusD family nutrient uptake outer membrane protein [Paludibacter sp.]